jgi:hypothetical protein
MGEYTISVSSFSKKTITGAILNIVMALSIHPSLESAIYYINEEIKYTRVSRCLPRCFYSWQCPA